MIYRTARHTDDLKPLVKFYTQVLGFEVLFSFENHNGYDGAFIGQPGQDWHLEFTASERPSDHKFDPEGILVFYPTEAKEYEAIVQRIESNGLERLKAENPYWNDNGIMIKDPDGFRVVVSNLKVE
ncbi:MAG: VOC family protein [Bacteroidota bacterium]